MSYMSTVVYLDYCGATISTRFCRLLKPQKYGIIEANLQAKSAWSDSNPATPTNCLIKLIF